MNERKRTKTLHLHRLAAVLLTGAASTTIPATVRADETTTATATATAAQPALEEKVAAVEGKTESLGEQLTALQPVVDALAKIKLSGYIQGRYENRQDSIDGLNAAGKPGTTSQFLVRRGRLKSTYAGQYAEFMLQLDAASSGVSLKDAEATLIEPWTGLGLRLTAGQFKWPFGYEVLQSSGNREMPERARVIRVLFPGERDRGVRFQGSWNVLRLSAALVNGNGTTDAIYSGNDQNGYKDLVGRLAVDLDWLVVGVSGYTGKGLATKLASGSTPLSIAKYTKQRIGADVQVYFDVPSVGGLALKGELISAKEPGDVSALGWYVLAVQNVGEHLGVFARLDSYDPDTNKDTNAITTIGGGAHWFFSGNLKGTAVYEHSITQVADGAKEPEDDILTLQLQAMF